MVVNFRIDVLRRGSLHMSTQMIVWWPGGRVGVHVNMCVECFAHVEEDKNSSSHGHIVGTGGTAKSIKHRE